jgi:RHS repeat-associated protein
MNGATTSSFTKVTGTADRADYYYAYLANPSSGTFQINFPNSTIGDYEVFTLQDAAQTNPIDTSNVTNNTSGSSKTTSITTHVGSDFVVSYALSIGNTTHSSFGTGETQITGSDQDDGAQIPTGIGPVNSTWKAAASTPGTESMTTSWNNTRDLDEAVLAVKSGSASVGYTTSQTYTYAGTNYANPHAVTQIANGVSTSTFAYDNDGNLIQKTTDGTTTTYAYDYANRLIAIGVGGATTTYGYDWAGNRVLQTGTSTTTIYPFKWYSIASSTVSGAKYATTTEYVFNGDTLVSTVDQELASGVATGSAKTLYIHPDHLGNTNVVTDASGTVAETLDFYPYGATRISDGTGANEKRRFIGQFSDDSGLSYLQARYYDPSRGQFLSEDPIFQQLGTPEAEKLGKQPLRQILSDPQALNSYSYAEDNPISVKDPSGLMSKNTQATLSAIVPLLGQLVNLLSQIVVQLGGGGSYNPASASTALLAHSTTLDPGP